jgi:HSP20 family protein
MFSLMPRRVRGEIVRSEPFEWFRRELSPLFDRAFPVWPVPLEVPWKTRWGLEMEETEDEYVVRAEVPGFEASELEVNLTGNTLTICAEHRPAEAKGPKVERPHGRLEKTMTLPEGVNPEKVAALYRNGVLEVHLPKAPGALTRRIEVRT